MAKLLTTHRVCNNDQHNLYTADPIYIDDIKKHKMTGKYNFVILEDETIRLSQYRKEWDNTWYNKWYNTLDNTWYNKCRYALTSHLHLSMKPNSNELENVIAAGTVKFREKSEKYKFKSLTLKANRGTFKGERSINSKHAKTIRRCFSNSFPDSTIVYKEKSK